MLTCKERLAVDNPDFDQCMIDEVVDEKCPVDYGYAHTPTYCGEDYDSCEKCWNREWPENNSVDNGADDKIKPIIKDSGDRTQFSTGAVRDMREGKGRFDIAPLEVITYMLNYDEGDCIINSIIGFMKNRDTEFLYDALNTFTAAYHNQVETMLLEVAVHFEEGAKKYGDANYRLGIPANCYIDSAVRHYLKWLRGDQDERHDRAFCWNLMCCIWEVDHHEYNNVAEKESPDDES